MYNALSQMFLSFGIMGFIAELWNYLKVTDDA